MSPASGALSASEEILLQQAAAAHALRSARAAFEAVPRTGAQVLALPGPFFPRPFAYTSAPENGGGRENHFQGCQLLADGRHLAVSGGDPLAPMSHLFIIRLPDGDGIGEVVARADIDHAMWHAGGIDRCGHIVAVPVECYRKPGFFKRISNVINGNPARPCSNDRSRIVFYWVADPANPVRLHTSVEREGEKATAVALTRWQGRFLLLVLSAKGLDFYYTRDATFSSGFGEALSCPAPESLRGTQCINLLRTADDELLLATFDNTGFVNPPLPKRNAARLFAVRVPSPGAGGAPAIEPLDAVGQFVCPEGLINFDGGAAFDARDGTLTLHTVFHFRDPATGAIRIGRFLP